MTLQQRMIYAAEIFLPPLFPSALEISQNAQQQIQMPLEKCLSCSMQAMFVPLQIKLLDRLNLTIYHLIKNLLVSALDR